MTHAAFTAVDLWIDDAADPLTEWTHLRQQLTSEGLIP